LDEFCKSYELNRKTEIEKKKEQKNRNRLGGAIPAQLGRTRGPKPGGSPTPAEPAQPRAPLSPSVFLFFFLH
jgi:hypothetical protein